MTRIAELAESVKLVRRAGIKDRDAAVFSNGIKFPADADGEPLKFPPSRSCQTI